MPTKDITLADLLERLDRSGGPEACWPWTMARDRRGYGRGGTHRGTFLAHRKVYLLSGGSPAPVVMHLCNNPPCCNPAHLRGGTQAENVAYTAKSGRHAFHVNPDAPARGARHGRHTHPEATARGEGSGTHKLTEAQALAIMARPESAAALAREFGVTDTTVLAVRNGRTWGWLTGVGV